MHDAEKLISLFLSLAVAGAGGLAAGALLMEGFEHHERREEDQAYDQGLNQGYDEGQSGFRGVRTNLMTRDRSRLRQWSTRVR